MNKLFLLMMAFCAVTMYAQTKEPEIQEFEYEGGQYRGEALNGKPHGIGILYYASTDPRMKYSGYYVNGERMGLGIMYWRNSDLYEGNWENGMENGEGTCVYANGDKYVGHWKDGEPCGEGTCIYANGDKYVGHWENGLWNGKGCYSHEGHDYVLVWKSLQDLNFLKIEGHAGEGNVQVSILFNPIFKDGKTENIGEAELNRYAMRTFKKYVNKNTK